MTHHLLAAWTLAGVISVVGLWTAPLERWAYRSEHGPRRKLSAYGITMLGLWLLALTAVWIEGWTPLLRSPAAVRAWLPVSAIAGPVLGAMTAAYVILALSPLLQSLRGPTRRAAYAAAMRRAFANLPGLLPSTAAERGVWLLLSLSAGVCEEILFRGFLIRLLHETGPALPLAGALGASSCAFGLGHAYQGFKGVLSTMIAGVFMGLLFLLTGSLIPGIVLHALMDMQVSYVLRPIPVSDAPTAAQTV